MLHELSEEQTTLHFCNVCRLKLGDRFKDRVSAMCMLRACDICGKIALCNVSAPMAESEKWIPLNEDGTAKETHIEREGV